MTEAVKEISFVAEVANRVIEEVERAIVGKKSLLKMVMASVLSEGHILLEDYPGLGKTLLAKSFATALGLDFKRIQFSPDLLPSDITGGYIFEREKSSFKLHKGPIFANIILADEINRASPKTQSALLEAMEEGQVTLDGDTIELPKPFIVLATQNPIEYEGTFPLPEAQLDRFLIKVGVGYPSAEEEKQILQRRRERRQDDFDLQKVSNPAEVLKMRDAIEDVYIDPDIEGYIIELVNKTREDSRVAVGASPRGSLALLKLTRAWASIQDRDFVLPDDVKKFAKPALVHRLILKPDLWLKQGAAEEVISSIISSHPVPVIQES